jgi:hypothetical protein
VSDARGNFSFIRVPAGKFSVSAKGLIANKSRTAQADIEVKPPPSSVAPLELQIR